MKEATKHRVQFRNWDCYIVTGNYFDGQLSIHLESETDGPIATASTYLEELPLSGNKTWIKTWSENQGILEALVDAGVVKEMGVHVEVNEFGSTAVLVKYLL